jgi:hypothetical protein
MLDGIAQGLSTALSTCPLPENAVMAVSPNNIKAK